MDMVRKQDSDGDLDGAMTQTTAAPMAVDDAGMFVTKTSVELNRVAKMLLATGAAPKSYTRPEQVVVAVQALKSMGLNPYVSLRQTGMINGSFVIWGDLPLALVRAAGELEWIEEFFFTKQGDEYLRQCFDNQNCHKSPFGAVCRIKRKGHPAHESVFTLEQAKQANLLNKPGPWTQYTDRMLRYRARSGALKDVFSDAMQGVAIREYDIEGVDRKDNYASFREERKPSPEVVRAPRQVSGSHAAQSREKDIEAAMVKQPVASSDAPRTTVQNESGPDVAAEKHPPIPDPEEPGIETDDREQEKLERAFARLKGNKSA